MPSAFGTICTEQLEDKDASCTDAGKDSGLLPPLPSMLGDPEPSPIEHEHWIKCVPDMLTCQLDGGKLEVVPNLGNPQEFAWRVRASFEVPKA